MPPTSENAAVAVQTEHDLWSLALSGQQIDASSLSIALEEQVARDDSSELDFRTRLLIRDSLNALGALLGTRAAG